MRVNFKTCSSCNKSKPIWKRVGKILYCKICWGAHKPIQLKPIVKQLVIPPRSPKRIKEDAEYSKRRKPFLKKHSTCEANLPGICTYQATDVHHMAGRIGDLLLDETYWKALCRACHVWVELNPEKAKEMRLSTTRLDKNV